MNKNIQPNYEETTITCACGNVMTVGSTKKKWKLIYAQNAIHTGQET